MSFMSEILHQAGFCHTFAIKSAGLAVTTTKGADDSASDAWINSDVI